MIRIGIVGCGRILNAHLHGYRMLREKGIDDFRITALCARRRDDALMFRRKGEGPPPRSPVMDPATGDPLAAPHIYLDEFQPDTEVDIFTDYREMLASDEVDAVNDFTSLFMHHQVGRDALEAGLHLLVEKPLAVSVRAGRMIVELARQNKLALGLTEVVRAWPEVRATRWLIEQGIIGELQMAFFGGIGGPWSPDKIVAETPWRHQKLQAGGGGAIDIGVHVMHLVRYICGEVERVRGTVRTFEPERFLRDDEGNVVQAGVGLRRSITANVDDTYLATATVAGGSLAHLMWSWGAHGEPLELPGAPAYYGSRGCIKGGEVILDDGTRRPAVEWFEAEAEPALMDRIFPLGLRDPFAIQQFDWLRAIQRGSQPEMSGEEGLRDLAAAYAIIESDRLGCEVALEQVLSGEVAGYQREIDEHYGLEVDE